MFKWIKSNQRSSGKAPWGKNISRMTKNLRKTGSKGLKEGEREKEKRKKDVNDAWVGNWKNV